MPCFRLLAALFALAVLSVPVTDAGAAKRKPAKPGPYADKCTRQSVGAAFPGLRQLDVWRDTRAYSFPFNGFTPRGQNPVLWRKFGEGQRRTHYPAPNLPSCRIARRGTEDRTTRKAGRFLPTLQVVDGTRSYPITDSFGRVMTTIHWEDESLVKRRPERWGWYVGDKWAGHDATRAFEVQGDACRITPIAVTTLVGDPATPVTTHRWMRDPNFTMIAFNPALGSPGGKSKPGKTVALRVRGFIDRRALPSWLDAIARAYDFGCGASPLAPMLAPQALAIPQIKSGYGPNRSYMVGQYFGESATQLVLQPGERQVHNNMPYNAYSPKPQFGNTAYASVATTGIAGGGMVRGVVRSGLDQLTLLDEMRYCDPNFTLRNMRLKRYGRKVSKWNYFELADFARENKPTVRWVYGEMRPPDGADPAVASANADPLSVRLYGWIPVNCDR